MKNKILSIMMLAVSVLIAAGCDDDSTAGMTRITYYPTITILGGEEVAVNVGETYTDAGCQVTLNGEDVSDQVQVSSNVNTNKMGTYTVTYTAINEDGFAKTASRTVYVVNEGAINTIYKGESQYGSRHYSGAIIYVTKQSDGSYMIDDLSGGFYWYGRYNGYEAYGYDFHLEALFTVNDDNTINIEEYGNWYWGDPLIPLQTGTYDPETGAISLVLHFGDNVPFYVNLTPITK